MTAVLARLIEPSAFGLVALASIAVYTVSTLQESGLDMALIHRRTDVEHAAATAWVLTCAMALALYGVVFGLAPLLGRLFHHADLTDVLRVLALLLPVRAFGLTSGALIERDLAFRSRAGGELSGAIVQACTAIPLAVAGAGVWALVGGQLAGQAVQALLFWRLAPFRPDPRRFSWRIGRELARYGRHITASNLLFLVNSNADTATIGRLLGATDLGYYSIAWRLSNLPATGISYIVGRVMFPAYSTIQDDVDAFRGAFLANVARVAMLALPVSVGIIVAADPIVVGIFGAAWRPAAEPLRVLAIFGLIRSFAGTTGAVFQAAGKPYLVSAISLWHMVVLIVALVVLTPPFGVVGAATAMTVAAFASFLPAFHLAMGTLRLPLRDLVRTVDAQVVVALGVAAAVAGADRAAASLPGGARLGLVIAAGCAAYAAGVASIARKDVRTIVAAFRA